MSTNNIEAPAPKAEPTPKFGLGSATGLTSVIGLWITALTAAFNASGPFYQDNGIITLFVTAVAGSLAFFGLRLPSVQGLVGKTAQIHDEYEARYQELLAQYNEQFAQFNDVVRGISDAQDGLPDELKDEVNAAPGGTPPNAEGTDDQAPVS